MSTFPGKLAIQQRVLPGYRAPFFDTLAGSCEGGLSLFAGQPRPVEAINSAQSLKLAQLFPANNRHLLSGPFYLCRQTNILEWLESWQPDALVLEANPRYLSSAKAIHWMHARGKPVLGWSLGAPAVSGTLAVFRRSSRLRFLRKLDGYISYSQRGADEHLALGLPADKVFVAHNAAALRAPAPLRLPGQQKSPFPPCCLSAGYKPAKSLECSSKPALPSPQTSSPVC